MRCARSAPGDTEPYQRIFFNPINIAASLESRSDTAEPVEILPTPETTCCWALDSEAYAPPNSSELDMLKFSAEYHNVYII